MLFRRTAAFCAAFLIATAMTGCGSLPFIGNNSADTDTASSEAEDVREDAEETAGAAGEAADESSESGETEAAGTAVPDLTLKIDSTFSHYSGQFRLIRFILKPQSRSQDPR